MTTTSCTATTSSTSAAQTAPRDGPLVSTLTSSSSTSPLIKAPAEASPAIGNKTICKKCSLEFTHDCAHRITPTIRSCRLAAGTSSEFVAVAGAAAGAGSICRPLWESVLVAAGGRLGTTTTPPCLVTRRCTGLLRRQPSTFQGRLQKQRSRNARTPCAGQRYPLLVRARSSSILRPCRALTTSRRRMRTSASSSSSRRTLPCGRPAGS